MFVLRTGLQGNSKTLNTIKEVDNKAAKEGRTVYYHNIREFKADHSAIKAEWVEFDNPQEWFKLPPNAIIVIDEAQSFFRVR
ncbi:zonular occludens toxin domain-containing protein, partial [Pseudomonas aeruginosa]